MERRTHVDMDWGVFCIYIVILVLGVLGNVVVMVVTLKNSRRCMPPVDLLISHLSVANFCSVITRSVPVLLFMAFDKEATGVVFCKLFGFFSFFSGSMSAWLTVLLSVYRTIKLCVNQPSLLTRALESTSTMKICLATIWVIWGALLSPTLMYLDKDKGYWNRTDHDNYSQDNGSSNSGNIRSYYGCALIIGHKRKDKAYLYICLVLSEILPATLMIIASTLTLRSLKKYKNMLAPAGALPIGSLKVNNWVGPVPSSRTKAHWKAGWLVLALMSTYLLCWATHFTLLATSFNKMYQLAPVLMTVGRMTYAFYPVLCPYGLGLGSRRFRVSLRNCMCRHFSNNGRIER